jgi:hypothetical protein
MCSIYNRAPVQSSHFIHASSQPAAVEGSGSTPKPKSTPRPPLSDLLRGFLILPLEDYKACERYCTSNQAIWSQDVKDLRELTIIYLREEKHEEAQVCAQRLLMITIAQQGEFPAVQANAFLKSLRKNDIAFQSELDKLIGRLGQESAGPEAVASPPKPYPPQSSSTNSDPRQPARRGSTVEHRTGRPLGVQNERLSGQVVQQRPQQEPHGTEFSLRGPRPTAQTKVSYTTHVQKTAVHEVEAAEAEEGSEKYPAIDTVDDAITLNEKESREKIDGTTQGVGPNLLVISDNQERNELHASYKVRKGREAEMFFVKGRVFAMVWHENVGIPAKSNKTETSKVLDKPFHRFTLNADGVTIFSHIRRFVIVKAKTKRRYCLAIPIHSYSGRGLTDKKMLSDEQQAHAIIYGKGGKPSPMSDEVRLDKEPIAVKLEEGEFLTPGSRLHFGRMQSIDWNVKVKNIGRIVDPKHMRRLIVYFEQEFRKADDTETEVEGESTRPLRA